MEEYCTISPDGQTRLLKDITPKRIATDNKTVLTNAFIDKVLPGGLFIRTMDTFNDAIVIPDKYDTYLKSLQPGEKPEVMVIAKESLALRSINLLIDNKDEIGSIIDPGSQIVAMSEEVCHELGLIYDPEV